MSEPCIWWTLTVKYIDKLGVLLGENQPLDTVFTYQLWLDRELGRHESGLYHSKTGLPSCFANFCWRQVAKLFERVRALDQLKISLSCCD